MVEEVGHCGVCEEEEGKGKLGEIEGKFPLNLLSFFFWGVSLAMPSYALLSRGTGRWLGGNTKSPTEAGLKTLCEFSQSTIVEIVCSYERLNPQP